MSGTGPAGLPGSPGPGGAAAAAGVTGISVTSADLPGPGASSPGGAQIGRAAGRLRHAEHVMGTVFSFDVPASAAPVLPEVLSWLHWVDATFSTYSGGSDVSRFGRGELTLAECAPELAEVVAACAVFEERSNGYFTAWPGARFDPSGLVKGWSIERASNLLSAAAEAGPGGMGPGGMGHSVNGAGDVQCIGEPERGRPWRVGVAHPLHPPALAVIVAGRDFAVATSGTAERGAHIVNPRTGRPATELASVTVVGPRIGTADAYATAAFAMGGAAREWAEGLDGYEVFAVAPDGASWQTSGFAAYTASA
ncbi:MAG: FAD:protein FMN transferase [Streptosporangiaceae bacterium]